MLESDKWHKYEQSSALTVISVTEQSCHACGVIMKIIMKIAHFKPLPLVVESSHPSPIKSCNAASKDKWRHQEKTFLSYYIRNNRISQLWRRELSVSHSFNWKHSEFWLLLWPAQRCGVGLFKHCLTASNCLDSNPTVIRTFLAASSNCRATSSDQVFQDTMFIMQMSLCCW